MIEITGDLFRSVKADAICITTNGCVKKDGTNVMGAGCAKEATKRWPGISKRVATGLAFGNTPQLLTVKNMEGGFILPTESKTYLVPYHIMTFPTKENWKDPSDLDLIKRSACKLREFADDFEWDSVVIPRPGCGLGQLSWEKDVQPLLAPILDDRFWIITFA